MTSRPGEDFKVRKSWDEAAVLEYNRKLCRDCAAKVIEVQA